VQKFSKKIDGLYLSARVASVLKNAGFIYIWQVAEKRETDLMRVKKIGGVSLNEIEEAILEEHGLKWGMDLSSVKEKLPGATPA